MSTEITSPFEIDLSRIDFVLMGKCYWFQRGTAVDFSRSHNRKCKKSQVVKLINLKKKLIPGNSIDLSETSLEVPDRSDTLRRKS